MTRRYNRRLRWNSSRSITSISAYLAMTDLKSDLSIGRTEGNDLVLNHPSVSRKHARIEARDGHWWIIDLKSTNGVKVNGNLITEAAVHAGDKMLIGSVQLDIKAMPSVDFSGESMFDNPRARSSAASPTSIPSSASTSARSQAAAAAVRRPSPAASGAVGHAREDLPGARAGRAVASADRGADRPARTRSWT